MKLPEKIKGRNRIRDAAIVLYFKRDAFSYIDLCVKFKLSERRIQQILMANHAYVKIDKEWEKEKRINRLQRWIKTAPPPDYNQLSLQQELRSELQENDNSNRSNETRVIIIRDTNNANQAENQRSDSASRVIFIKS